MISKIVCIICLKTKITLPLRLKLKLIYRTFGIKITQQFVSLSLSPSDFSLADKQFKALSWTKAIHITQHDSYSQQQFYFYGTTKKLKEEQPILIILKNLNPIFSAKAKEKKKQKGSESYQYHYLEERRNRAAFSRTAREEGSESRRRF